MLRPPHPTAVDPPLCDHSQWETTTLHPAWTNYLHNFTLQDIAGSLVATLAFTAVLYAPGYLVAHAANLFGFRRRFFAERSLWAIAVSFCVSPIAAHLLARLCGLAALSWFFALTAVPTIYLLTRAPDRSWLPRDRRLTTLLVLGWTAVVLLLLVDFQIGGKLYFSVVMADESYRIAFTDAVLRTNVPPANPLYFAGAPAPMRYYYFWYILCAAVAKISATPARDAFYASCIWAGFGLLITVGLYTRHFFQWERSRRHLAFGLLLVTGADLLPAVGQALLQPTLNGDTEWWSVDPIDAWPDSLLWVPHHVAAVLCCLLAFLLLWLLTLDLDMGGPGPYVPDHALDRGPHSSTQHEAPVSVARDTFTRTSFPILLLTAAAFASAFGLSVYVTSGFALLLLAWLIRTLLLRDRHWKKWLQQVITAAALSVLLLIPFFRELLPGLKGATSPQPQGLGTPAQPHLFVLSVRRLIDSELLTTLPVLDHVHRTHPTLLDQSVRLFLLPPGLAMELGVYGAALLFLLLAKRRKRLLSDPARDTAIFFAVVGLLLTMFLSSSVITNNDFGYRAVMLPQFFLILLAADLLASWRLSNTFLPIPATPARRRLLRSLVALGAAGTLYWAVLLRAWLPLVAARSPVAPDLNYATLPEDNFEIRDAFDILDRTAPMNAIVAFRPIDPTPDRQGAVMVPNEYYQRALVMDTGRGMLNAEGKCAVHFGGDPTPCAAIQAATARLYASPVPDAAYARNFCTRFGVHYLVLSAWDPLWSTRTGWPASLPSVALESRIRIFNCRPEGG